MHPENYQLATPLGKLRFKILYWLRKIELPTLPASNIRDIYYNVSTQFKV